MRFPENGIAAAAFLFEKAHGSQLSEFEQREIDRHGFDGIAPELVANELRAAVEQDSKSDSTFRQQAYWALGKNFDQAMTPLFRERLSLELRRDLIVAYQIMIALDNLGEPAFSDSRSGYSMHEYDLNRLDGEAYLESAT